MKALFVTTILMATLLAAGCSSTQSMIGSGADRSSATMFPLSAEQADRILATAMAGEFAGSPVSRVEFPNKGYQATIRFMLDSHTIIGYMIATKGKATDGSLVDGFYFEVANSGTMPLSGGNRAKKLFERLVRDASMIARPLPLSSPL
jgi:hypothetical protein